MSSLKQNPCKDLKVLQGKPGFFDAYAKLIAKTLGQPTHVTKKWLSTGIKQKQHD